MNDVTNAFVENLQPNDNVLGVILFGSWARGNSRPDSDVDLIVILREGYERKVEYLDNQAFEIVYTTAEGAMEHWQRNLNDAADLWGVANILYDREGVIEMLQREINEVIQRGKPGLGESEVGQLEFSAEYSLKAATVIQVDDSATANLVLEKTVLTLTEQFFDVRQMWTPAPKQILGVIKGHDATLHGLLIDFYSSNLSFEEKIAIANKIVDRVFV